MLLEFDGEEINVLKNIVSEAIEKTKEDINNHLNNDITGLSNRYNVLYRIKLKCEAK